MGQTGRSAYQDVATFSGELMHTTLRFAGKPGIPQWNRISDASELLAEYAEFPATARILVMGCGHGALGAWLAQRAPQGHITLLDTNIIALRLAEQTLRLNGATNANIHPTASILPEGAGSFDVVVMELPKSRPLIRRWLVEAQHALRPNGMLYLAGPKDEGIQPAIADAEALFGIALQLAYRARNRVASAQRLPDPPTIPPWSAEPGIVPGTWVEIDVELSGQTRRLASLPGVFAYDRLDDGTRLLLEQLQVPPKARVLDMGCGYGVIGLTAALRGARQVDMIDADLLAVASSRENCTRLQLPQVQVFSSDTLDAVQGKQYDLIVSNPPFHVGKTVEYDVARTMLEQARDALSESGALWIVANQFLRYDRPLRELFGQVERVSANKAFHIFRALR